VFKYNRHNSNTYNSILRKKNVIISFVTIAVYVYLSTGITYVPIENLGIISGIGMDINYTSPEAVEYGAPISVYSYIQNAATTNIVHTGVGSTLQKAQENRQLKFNKKFLMGLEKVVVISEAAATYSIRPRLEIFFTSPNINDTSLTAICKGTSEDMLKLNIKGYPSSSDYIEGMIRHATNLNFFSDNYKVMDMYVRVDAEGRSLVLPYIEVHDNTPMITGMALFDKDKMKVKIEINDIKPLNLLRENNVRGNLNLQKNPDEYIDFYCTSKRKVKCEKINNKYNFSVDLSIIGNVVENSLYVNMQSDSKVKEKFEKDMAKATEKMCMDFIAKMQSQYKLDAIELGRVAAATFGRGTGINWNEIICNPDLTNIKVNVKVKVDNMGRGDY
jgi:Ger(x)C family germination protein